MAACRGRGLRVDRLTVEASWTRPQPVDPDFFGVWVREADGYLRDLVRPGDGGVAGLPPRPRQAATPPASASPSTAVSVARSSTGSTALVASASATRHWRLHGGPRAHGGMTRSRIGSSRTTTNFGKGATTCGTSAVAASALRQGRDDVWHVGCGRIGIGKSATRCCTPTLPARPRTARGCGSFRAGERRSTREFTSASPLKSR